jgi:hypothetical protein
VRGTGYAVRALPAVACEGGVRGTGSWFLGAGFWQRFAPDNCGLPTRRLPTAGCGSWFLGEGVLSYFPLTLSPSHPLTLSPSHPLTNRELDWELMSADRGLLTCELRTTPCPMLFAPCPMLFALCSLPFALCPMPYLFALSLCPMLFALCPMPYLFALSLCPMLFALCPMLCAITPDACRDAGPNMAPPALRPFP